MRWSMEINFNQFIDSSFSNLDNLKYWARIWEMLCSKFDNGTISTRLITPSFFLNELLDEINHNKLSRLRNRKLFIGYIEDFIKYHNLVKTYYKDDFIFLKGLIENLSCDKSRYLCNHLLNQFRKDEYSLKLFDALLHSLTQPSSSVNNKLIEELSNEVIVELLLLGHDLKDISKYIDVTFSSYIEFENDGVPYTRFDFTNFEDYTLQESNQSKLDIIKKSYLDNLKLIDRIKTFSSFIKKESRKYYVALKVYGFEIKGKAIFEYQGMKLYNSSFVQVLDNPNEDNLEFSNRIVSDKFSNLLIETESKTPNAAIQFAKSKAEIMLDLIRFYLNSSTRVVYLTDEYQLINSDSFIVLYSIPSKLKSGSKEFAEKHPFMLDSINFDRTIRKLTDALNAISKTNSAYFYCVQRSISFFSKAEQSTSYSDKILNYWISIENLYNSSNSELATKAINDENVIEQIINTIPQVCISYFATEQLVDLINYIEDLYYEQGLNKTGPNFDFSDDTMSILKLGNMSDNVIDAQSLIDSLSIIRNNSFDALLKEKLEHLVNFYSSNKYASDTLKYEIKQRINEILLIYKTRNQITHNAFSNTRMLPFFTGIAKNLCKTMITECKNGIELGHKEFFETTYKSTYLYDKLKSKLNSNSQNTNVFDYYKR